MHVKTWLVPYLCAALLLLTAPTLATTPDVRVLIDVSGSMKANDPANLRRPALRMLVELLPEDSVAGVWLFAEDTQPLVRHDTVSKEWKTTAVSAAERIHSRGLFTNIESALDAATEGWTAGDPNTRRSLILLTDGVVDVSKKAEQSAASRQRILQTGLRKLQNLGVTVHTIGLSENVDAELMNALSNATDGWQESAGDAATLQRIFLRMFEAAVQPETVPLQGNRFQIDSSISEFTVLLFSASSEREVKLVLPDGTSVGANDHPDSFRWRVDNGYNLITVAGPVPGEWRVEADVDPDNRVMIVTDLAFEVSPLAANALKGEQIELSAFVTEQGERVERLEFLELIDVSAVLVSDELKTTTALTLDVEQSEFGGDVADELQAGRYEVVVRADSKTFSRESRQRIVVHDSPLQITVVKQPDATVGAIVRVELNPDLVTARDLLALGTYTHQSGEQQLVEPTLESEQALLFETPLSEGQGEFGLRVSLRSPSGRALHLEPPAVLVGEPVTIEPTTEAGEEAAVQTADEPGVFDFKLGSMVIGGANLGFLTIAGLTWACLRRPKRDADSAKPKAKKENKAKAKKAGKKQAKEPATNET